MMFFEDVHKNSALSIIKKDTRNDTNKKNIY